jgi:DNA end-binding protein Ku
MAQKVWRGFLNFGMLSVPVFLNVAARDKRVDLHTYHTACNSQIKAPKFCPACQLMLEPTEVYRGYDAGNGIIKLTDEEMESITPATEKVMEISECVKWSDVDPLYLAESYYLLPDDAGKKAYSLLVKALSDSGRVAIVQLTKSSREHVALIRPKGNGLMLHYVWYENEVNRVAEFESLAPAGLSANEVKLAGQLVANMAGDFNPSQYEDGYMQRLNTLIASKQDKKIQAPAPVNTARSAATVDIAAALEASLINKPRRRILPQEDAPATNKKGKGRRAA